MTRRRCLCAQTAASTTCEVQQLQREAVRGDQRGADGFQSLVGDAAIWREREREDPLLIHSRCRFELLRMKLQSAVTPFIVIAFPVMLSAASDWFSVPVLTATQRARSPGSVMPLSPVERSERAYSPREASAGRGRGCV